MRNKSGDRPQTATAYGKRLQHRRGGSEGLVQAMAGGGVRRLGSVVTPSGEAEAVLLQREADNWQPLFGPVNLQRGEGRARYVRLSVGE